MSGFDLGDYVGVDERIRELRDKYPDASLQPANPLRAYEVVEVAGKTFIVYTAACYRSPDDARPGIGIAWEPFPGPTTYTRDSELQNAETSAWGRAIVAALAADTRRGIASANEVRNRSGNGNGAPPQATDKQRLVAECQKRSIPATKANMDAIAAEWAKVDGSGADPARENPAGPETGDDSAASSDASSPETLPPADEEEALAGQACVECGSTKAKKVLAAEGRVVCRDRRGCEGRVEDARRPM